MPGLFRDSDKNLIGRKIQEIDPCEGASLIKKEGCRSVYRGFRKVLLVEDNGTILDFYDWKEPGSNQFVKWLAKRKWGIYW